MLIIAYERLPYSLLDSAVAHGFILVSRSRLLHGMKNQYVRKPVLSSSLCCFSHTRSEPLSFDTELITVHLETVRGIYATA